MEIEENNYVEDEEAVQNANLEIAFNYYLVAFNDVQQKIANYTNGCEEGFINCALHLSNSFVESIRFAQNQLNQWRNRQRHLSIGPTVVQNQHYENLENLRQKFVGIQHKLKTTMESVFHYKAYQLPNPADVNYINGPHRFFNHANQFYWQLHEMSTQMLTGSIVLSQQPPALMQISRADVNVPRASRNRFDLGIEVLGATAWLGQEGILDNGKIQCFVRKFGSNQTEEGALESLNIYQDANMPSNEEFMPAQKEECPKFELVPLPNDEQQLKLMAKYSLLGVIAAQKTSRRTIQNIQYRFCLCINILLFHQIGINCWVVTLPFAATYCKNVQVKTEIILKRLFPTFTVTPNPNIPEETANAEIIGDILELIFQEEIYSNDTNANYQIRGLSPQSRNHLLANLAIQANGRIALKNFFKIPVESARLTSVNVQHKPLFNEWFFRLAEIIRDGIGLRQLWDRGLIYGFCSKLEAQEILLVNYQLRMMVIRFSISSMRGDIKITCGKQNNVRHAGFSEATLMKKNMAIELLENEHFHNIDYILNSNGQPFNLRLEINQLLRPIAADVGNDDGDNGGDGGVYGLDPVAEYLMNQVEIS